MAEDGAAKVALVEELDAGDGMQCSEHPYKKSPGGICAFCLQDKLGKLVSSSFPALPILGRSSSSSPSPSFRSDIGGVYGGFNQSAAASSAVKTTDAEFHQYHARRTRMLFLYPKKKKKSNPSEFAAFKRSKSTTSAPRRGSFLADPPQVFEKSPRRRRAGLWPFLYLSSSSSKPGISRSTDRGLSGSKITSFTNPRSGAVEDDNGLNPRNQAIERKVSRSRSVGCGSRSFSGDFFERISNGFGDCTLRRVESQREAKPSKSSANGRQNNHQSMKERVRCGGLFGGFMLTSSSSSSSSSSHWVSDEFAANNRPAGSGTRQLVVNGRNHHRSSWGWAFASPMRAFSRPSSKDGKRLEASNKNKTVPNLDAIPSLLTASG